MNAITIEKAIAIQAEINHLNAELEKLKDEIRTAAAGESAKFIAAGGFVTVNKPAADTTVLDAAAWKKAAPKMYAETLEKYHKTRRGSIGAVTVSPCNK